MASTTILNDTAQSYIAAGLCTLPASRSDKFPTVGKWGKYQDRMPTEVELTAWFANWPGQSENRPSQDGAVPDARGRLVRSGIQRGKRFYDTGQGVAFFRYR